MEANTTQRLWRNSIDDHLTEELLEVLIRQTTLALKHIERTTPWRDQLGVDERINNAIVKVMDGQRIWNPTRCSLGAFLYNVVRSDTWAEIEHAIDFPKVPVERSALRLVDSCTNTKHEAADGYFTLVMDELRVLARKDRQVLRLLDFYRRGTFDRADIMRETKWSARAYGNVRQRLLRLADLIDDELRETVVEALAN